MGRFLYVSPLMLVVLPSSHSHERRAGKQQLQRGTPRHAPFLNANIRGRKKGTGLFPWNKNTHGYAPVRG